MSNPFNVPLKLPKRTHALPAAAVDTSDALQQQFVANKLKQQTLATAMEEKHMEMKRLNNEIEDLKKMFPSEKQKT